MHLLLKYNRGHDLAKTPWRVLEIKCAEDIEIVLRRIVRHIPIFARGQTVEIFVHKTYSEHGWIFARSNARLSLSEISSVHGSVKNVFDAGRALLAPDDYVQKLIRHARREHKLRCARIRAGRFVRIRDGFTRDYCGIVERVDGVTATVKVKLFTRSITIETTVGNLEEIPPIAAGRKLFYCLAKGERRDRDRH